MPNNNNHAKNFKFSSSSYIGKSASSSGSSQNTEKPSKSVNELLANLRRTSLRSGSSSASTHSNFPPNSPSVPPAIGEILQIPRTPEPAPRRRFVLQRDDAGRRLPAGPPPPRSWTSRANTLDLRQASSSATLSKVINPHPQDNEVLPGVSVPQEGSLVNIALQSIAAKWYMHRSYDGSYLYYLPAHLKSALIRLLGIHNDGVQLSDLRMLLLPPIEEDMVEEPNETLSQNADMYFIDLTGSPGHSIRLKELFKFLFPFDDSGPGEDVKDSWDAPETTTSLPRSVLPNLTHLSLALQPGQSSNGSWRQLLSYAHRLSTITHLSLANWPAPCLTPMARDSTVVSPQGQRVAYSGTNMYSHDLDQDWSEALLVLRMLSKSLYKLEFLDLTGCSSWFNALMAESEHDHVDWVGSWGKITTLRMYNGWTPDAETMPSRWQAFREGMSKATAVEKHIRTARAGKGRFVTVEQDKLNE